MATEVHEGKYPGEFIATEATGDRSRDIIVVSGSNGELEPGQVLGQLTHDTVSTNADAGNTGTGDFAATPTPGPDAEQGGYTVEIVETAADGGTFVVHTPSGVQLAKGTVGAAYSNDHLSFTLQDGATDFAAGDTFTVTISGSGEWAPYDDAATDGTEHAAGILYGSVDTTAGSVEAVAVVRDAEVAEADLTGVDAAAKEDLAGRGIIAR
jgi:hypothetical protein